VSRLPNESRVITSRWLRRGSTELLAVIVQGKLLNNTGSKSTAQCFISSMAYEKMVLPGSGGLNSLSSSAVRTRANRELKLVAGDIHKP
jgi:hypothetical protein